MTTRSGPLIRAQRSAADDEARVLAEIQRGRRGAGLSIAELGRAAGLSRSAASRSLAGRRPVSVREYALMGAAVGLDVRLRAYPAGDPIRDAAQQRLIERLRRRLHPGLRWRTEVVLQGDRDLRAWDGEIRGDTWRLPVDAETTLDDVQAVERRVARKQRDDGADHVLVLVADTRRNRRALAAAPAPFGGFSRDARTVLNALREGRDPGASAVILA